ncbi:MAG: DUF2911 domain-containing protein [Flavobacteriaceae bacterium]|nr:DUF2911 domain-containing protein [Flavobacteriaceae bacterium]
MKKRQLLSLIVFTLTLVFSSSVSAQKFAKIDKSPLDIASYRTSRTETPIVKVVYSRPMKKGRDIFGKLIPYGKIWRTGANECTEVTFTQDVIIGGKTISAGTYSLFTIPNENEWTIILNSVTDQWGAYSYDESKDVARVTVSVEKTNNMMEAFSIAFSKTDRGATMYMAWDNTMISVPIEF